MVSFISSLANSSWVSLNELEIIKKRFLIKYFRNIFKMLLSVSESGAVCRTLSWVLYCVTVRHLNDFYIEPSTTSTNQNIATYQYLTMQHCSWMSSLTVWMSWTMTKKYHVKLSSFLFLSKFGRTVYGLCKIKT